jgi:glycosyltransferase involved in cell wall biosynthesis
MTSKSKPLILNDIHEINFTVFTPTYNRSDKLQKLFESLEGQTCKNFEWLIVDGGDDNTESLINHWVHCSSFQIRYVRQTTVGLHAAYNLGASLARGELFLSIHSDDTCLPETLECFLKYWMGIPIAERKLYSGIWARCLSQRGVPIGRSLGVDWLDSTYQEMIYKKGHSEEMFPLVRTEVLRKYPFPTIEGTRFIPEGFVWRQIGVDYKTRYIDRPLRLYTILDQSVSSSDQLTSLTLIKRNLPSLIISGREVLINDISWVRFAPIEFLRISANYVRWSLHSGIPIGEQLRNFSWLACITWAAAFPLGLLKYLKDRRYE